MRIALSRERLNVLGSSFAGVSSSVRKSAGSGEGLPMTKSPSRLQRAPRRSRLSSQQRPLEHCAIFLGGGGGSTCKSRLTTRLSHVRLTLGCTSLDSICLLMGPEWLKLSPIWSHIYPCLSTFSHLLYSLHRSYKTQVLFGTA